MTRRLHRPPIAHSPQRRELTFLGIGAGLFVGCGILVIFAINIVLYVAEWGGALLAPLGVVPRKVGVLVGFVVSFGLYLSFWAAVGASAVKLFRRKGDERDAA